MKAKLQQIAQRVDTLSVRERGILAVVLAVVLVFVWLQLVYLPWDQKQSALIQTERQLNAELVSYAAELEVLERSQRNNPNQVLADEVERLQQQLAQQQSYINRSFGQLMSPEEMADTLRQLLSEFAGMTLVNARNLPVEGLSLSPSEAAQPTDETAPLALIYQHGFEMTLEGKYFDALGLLQRLEQVSGFYWHRVDYQVDKYPNAQLTLQLRTLSLHEDWIGV